MIQLILIFVVGLLPSWNTYQITDAYRKTEEALFFLHGYGVPLAQPQMRVIGAPLDQLTWYDASLYTRGLDNEFLTVYLVLYPQDWWRNGYAGEDHAAAGYREQYYTWSPFTAVVAHEILHTLGATDKYDCVDERHCSCVGPDPDLMCDLRYRRLNNQTLSEIQRYRQWNSY